MTDVHFHLLINPLPIFGSLFALLLGLYGAVRRHPAVVRTAFFALVVCGVGLAAAAVSMGPQGAVYALPEWVRALFALPIAGTALGVLGAAAALPPWRQGLGSRAARVHLAAVALAIALVVPLLAQWGLYGLPR